jgi:hypothetical protein
VPLNRGCEPLASSLSRSSVNARERPPAVEGLSLSTTGLETADRSLEDVARWVFGGTAGGARFAPLKPLSFLSSLYSEWSVDSIEFIVRGVFGG